MKKLLLLPLIFVFTCLSAQQHIVTADIKNFWQAYDKIKLTKDSAQQLDLINRLYINKGTPGLVALMQARNYTPQQYISAINHYPTFWSNIRKNTLKADSYANKIENAVRLLGKIYPSLKPAKIYFSIGALRTGGTTLGDKVLIGAEISMADENINAAELNADYPHLPVFFKTNPINGLVFTNTHEYVHTQQKTTIGNSLLAQTVIEGVAEFLAEKALNVASPNAQIAFGKANDSRIKKAFEKEMFSPSLHNWLYNSADNQFNMRDLGYYVGYAICKKYEELATDKKQAAKEMIELDYNNEDQLMNFVEKSQYFEQPLAVYKETFEKSRPKITGIKEFENGSNKVSAATKTVTLYFSEPMDINTRGFDFGPLGQENVLMVQRVIGFSADKKSFSYEVSLMPNKRYQSLATERFRNAAGIPIKPYLIDFKTSE
jgi:hypothetical protein